MNRKVIFIIAFIFLIEVNFVKSAEETGKVDSVYTEISKDNCEYLPPTGEIENDEGSLLCDGPANYKFLTHVDDDRASVSIVDPDGTQHDLNFWHVVTRQFSSLGPRAEWRVLEINGKQQPFAFIARVKTIESVDNHHKVVSYLAIVKIADGNICVIDRIRSTGNENIEARKAAELASEKECLNEME